MRGKQAGVTSDRQWTTGPSECSTLGSACCQRRRWDVNRFGLSEGLQGLIKMCLKVRLKVCEGDERLMLVRIIRSLLPDCLWIEGRLRGEWFVLVVVVVRLLRSLRSLMGTGSTVLLLITTVSSSSVNRSVGVLTEIGTNLPSILLTVPLLIDRKRSSFVNVGDGSCALLSSFLSNGPFAPMDCDIMEGIRRGSPV